MRNLITLPRSFANRSAAQPTERATGSLGFDLVMVSLALWFLGGLYLDGWAHQHIPSMETFFTPWHGVLYSGFLASASALAFVVFRNIMRGYSGWQALPAGYELSLAGVAVFTVGGIGDLIWHTVFGIEADTEALLSPTHLLLALGMTLILTGPLRAAWYRAPGSARRWVDSLPTVLSVTFMLSMLGFFTQYAHPFGRTLAAAENAPNAMAPVYGQLTKQGLDYITFYTQSLGIVSILLQSAFLMGMVLLVVRRGLLPVGGMTLILTLSTGAMLVMRDQALGSNPIATGIWPMLGVAVLGGLAADLLLWWLKPSVTQPGAFRWFAFAVPTLLYMFYFATLGLLGGVWWSIHVWTGAAVLAGTVGLLLSYAFVPPAGAQAPATP